MSEYGLWSVLPPIVAIFLALRTKQVYLSLLLGIFCGWLVINNGNPFFAIIDTIAAFVHVFEDNGNTRTIFFTLLVGILIAFIQRSGGVQGFVDYINLKLDNNNEYTLSKTKLQFFASLTGLVIFVESNISILTVGTIFRPLFDKNNISREKLAYLADSSSAPSCIIFPFNAWGAYIMSLLVMLEISNPFGVLMHSLLYNFYPFLALAILYYIVFSGNDFGPMKRAESRVRETNNLFDEHSTPMISQEIDQLQPVSKIKHSASNMIIPLSVLIVTMPLALLYTGWYDIVANETFFTRFITAMGQGSGSSAVLYAVCTSILVAMLMYKFQRIMKVKEMVELSLRGMSGMLSLALLMVMAFTLGALCKELNTGVYIADVTKEWLSPKLVPAIIFVVSCFIAFSTGTSWGTFAIMLSIAVPMSQSLDTNLPLAIAAAIGGGVFGDHCSPISDTTIISSMASGSDHIDHVKTQLPYALIAGGGTLLLYIILGVIS